MKTTIDNNLRVFQIVDSFRRSTFCNLHDINKVVKEKELKTGYFKRYHFWDSKPAKVSQKYLKEMFEANQIKQDFFYQSR